MVTNLEGELTSQAEMHWMLMEKCKQLEESNQIMSQQMMSMNQQIAASFFQIQQASGSGSQPFFTNLPQHDEENEDEDEDKEYDDTHLDD